MLRIESAIANETGDLSYVIILMVPDNLLPLGTLKVFKTINRDYFSPGGLTGADYFNLGKVQTRTLSSQLRSH